MKELVVILSHADTKDKIDTLRSCLDEIKKQNYKILVSSHIEIPQDIKNDADYFIYDKENPLIYHWEFPNLSHIYIWHSYAGYSQTYAGEYHHSYAVLKLIKNGLTMAYVNNYNKVHFVNYDYILYDPDVLKKHSKYLDNYDVFSYYYTKFEENKEHINTGLFSTKVEHMYNILKQVNSKEDFLKLNQSIFEKYMYYQITNNGLTMEREDQELLLNSENKLNTKSLFKNVIDDKIHIYLSKENKTGEYYIYINSTKGDLLNVNLTIGNIFKNWQPIPYKVNLLKIPTELLVKGINIHIPEFDFYDFYDIDTHHANCDITDHNLIQEIDWNLHKENDFEKYITTKDKSFKELNELHGSDKVSYHGYHFFYTHFLEKFRYDNFNMLEIGYGGGLSLKSFVEYFPKADITIMDINEELIHSDRCRVVKGDQSNIEDLDNIIKNIKKAKFIIDDGSHNPQHQFDTFNYLFKNLLQPGGVYIIEDIELSYWNPESTLYGYKSGYFNLLDSFKKYQEMINSEFTGVKNYLDISTITYAQNCIIITKRTEEEKLYFDRIYRFSDCINGICHHG
jgi:hypothetical protein